MKKTTLLWIAFVLTLNTYSQTNKAKAEDLGRIVLAAFVPEQIDNMPAAARNILENKLSQIVTQEGMGGDPSNQRFIITANVVVITKDITSTAPPMIALTLEITLYIGDGIAGTKFASTGLSVKGVGTNETKAYIAALKNIKLDPSIQAFLETGKAKIIQYYYTKCDFLIKEAQTLARQDEYEEAIYKLTSVPEVCKTCYTKSMDAVGPIYQKQLDKVCLLKLAEATNIWNANQDLSSANSASDVLSQIDPRATCFKDVKLLVEKIAKRIKEIDKRAWGFKLNEQQNEADIIKAARDVSIAYYSHQPKAVIYNVHGWW